MTTEKEIRKVKLDRSGNLQITYDEIIHHENGEVVINKVNVCDGHKVHPDLKHAFNNLRVHMVLICEQTEIAPEENENADPEFIESNVLENFKVTGFNIAGGDADGVTLIGNRKTALGTLNIVSPFVKYEESGYRYIDALMEAVNYAISEVHKYLEGKYAIEIQLSLVEEFEGDIN